MSGSDRFAWSLFGATIMCLLVSIALWVRNNRDAGGWVKAPAETYLLDSDNTYRMYRIVNRHGDAATAVPLVPMKVPVVLARSPRTGELEWVIDCRRRPAGGTPEPKGGD